jgi:hypothetical protein
MRFRTIHFWTLTLALLGGTFLCAPLCGQCPATAAPGQFISFQLTATFNNSPLPDGGTWSVSPNEFSANPPNTHVTTISGTIPGNASGSINLTASYFFSVVYTFNCTIQISIPLQINGACPANNFAPGAPINVPFSASGGNTQNYNWSVTSPFTVSQPTGTNTTVQGVAPASSTSFTVTLSETGSFGGPNPAPPTSRTCQITVSPPLQINGACPAGNYAPGDPINDPFSASGGTTQQYVWNVTAPFTASPSAGANTAVQGFAPTASTSFTITLSETGSSASPSTSRTCQITVVIVNTPLQINGTCPTNSFLPNTAVSVAFSASGGNTHLYVWGASGGGFAASPQTGPNTIVQGNTQPTGSSFTLVLSETKPMNSALVPAAPVSITCTLDVPLAPLTIVGTCPTGAFAPGGSVNIPLQGQGGSGQYSWDINPAGGLKLTSLTKATTTVFGIPVASPGSQFKFVVTLSDTALDAQSVTFSCTIIIAAALHIDGVCPTQALVTGVAFSLPLTGSGGVPPYLWRVGDGPLLPSSNIGSTIMVAGTPSTPGSFDLIVSLGDSIRSPNATFQCSIRVVAPVLPPLSIGIGGPSSCPIAQVQGKTVTVPLSGTGGSGNYSWTVTGPAFLSLTASSGASTSLTGIATDAGSFPFTVSLTDDAKTPLAAFSCSVLVVATLNLNPSTLPDGVVNQVYPNATIGASGGSPPLGYGVTKGSLPPGLALDPSSGVISGTPPKDGTFVFTVTVTDAGAGSLLQSQSADYQITVYPVLQNSTSCPLPTGQEAQPYNAPLTATGGTGQYTFSLSGGGVLPPGLALTQNAISGTPQGPFPSATLSFQVASGSQNQTFSCAIAVLGRKPTVTLNGSLPNSGGSLLTATLTLDAPVQEDVKGTAVLSFIPDVPNTAIKDNPQVQFCGGNTGDPLCSTAQKDSAGLLRVIPFTIPAGTGSFTLSPLLTSNVAGAIQIAPTNLTVGPQSITAAPLRLTIPRTAPVILASQASLSGQSLTIALKVVSSTCELASATVAFTAASGSQLEGTSDTIDLSGVFRSFTPSAVDSTHTLGGCAFALTLPFSISGDPRAVSTVALTLANAVGTTSSAALTVQ